MGPNFWDYVSTMYGVVTKSCNRNKQTSIKFYKWIPSIRHPLGHVQTGCFRTNVTVAHLLAVFAEWKLQAPRVCKSNTNHIWPLHNRWMWDKQFMGRWNIFGSGSSTNDHAVKPGKQFLSLYALTICLSYVFICLQTAGAEKLAVASVTEIVWNTHSWSWMLRRTKLESHFF